MPKYTFKDTENLENPDINDDSPSSNIYEENIFLDFQKVWECKEEMKCIVDKYKGEADNPMGDQIRLKIWIWLLSGLRPSPSTQ